VRSRLIHYDDDMLPLPHLTAELERIEATLPDSDGAVLPSRIVHMPLAKNR
jgi:hypothetical protein